MKKVETAKISNKKSPVDIINEEILALTFLAEKQRKMRDDSTTEDILSILKSIHFNV